MWPFVRLTRRTMLARSTAATLAAVAPVLEQAREIGNERAQAAPRPCDPERKLTVIAFTNTGLEGGFGAFPVEIRDAVYGRGG